MRSAIAFYTKLFSLLSLYRVETEIGNLVDVAEDGDFGSGGGDDDEGEV